VSKLTELKAWEWSYLIRQMPMVLFQLYNDVADFTAEMRKSLLQLQKATSALLQWAKVVRQAAVRESDLLDLPELERA
jgi:hypothetical protein